MYIPYFSLNSIEDLTFEMYSSRSKYFSQIFFKWIKFKLISYIDYQVST